MASEAASAAPASRAAGMRSIAQQSLSDLGGPSSVLARQKSDHVELEGMLRRLGEVPNENQGSVLLDIYRLVFPHAFAEEAVLWPVIRKVLPDGDELTLKVEREHQDINELVTRLEGLAPDAPERPEVLDRTVALLRQDVRDEEDVLLPRLQSRLSPTQLEWLGLAWELVRQIAPTRAHPIVSRRPPGNVLAALPLSLIDHARDQVDAALAQGAGHREAVLRVASSALAHASHAVETMPILREGEDPSTHVDRTPRAPWGAMALAALSAPLLFALVSRPQRPGGRT